MIQQIINDIVPIITTAIGGILVVIINRIGEEVINYISKKKEEVAVKVGTAKYNDYLEKAKAIYALVDEEFRITPTLKATIEAKQNLFNTELKKIIPSLTDEEINQLRQIVAGEINKGKDVVVSPATEPVAEVKVETIANGTIATTPTETK